MLSVPLLDLGICHVNIFLTILKQAGDDPNKAVDLFFQTEAANGIAPKVYDMEGSDEEEDKKDISCVETPALRQAVNIDDGASKCSAEGTPQAEELSGLLGEEVKRDIILTLLRRSRNNLQQAVEIYFSENRADADFDEGSDEEEEEVADAGKMPLSSNIESDTIPSSPSAPISVSKTVTSPTGLSKSPQAPSESPASLPQTPFEAHYRFNIQLETDDAKITAPTIEEESLYGPGTFEVVVSSSKFCWQIGNVFGRAVVQYVQPGGPAALAGIQKSDVLLAFRDIVLNEENCTAVVQQLSKERVVVPSALRFRRALDPHSQSNTVIKENGLPKASSV
ncbi:hypothetical protein PsorP6_000257 [Peronosclerospora sorghi]|uniref:Uncharacterized protein n=1 Tax=Peronosclerospora sorghi TaxID=230839 RepID=A0ACC0WVW7_9STRA|nr:hypothetical protein PsorP6_000257 [Peronosclerospora sorghi]